MRIILVAALATMGAPPAPGQLMAHDLRIPPVPGRHVLVDAHGSVKMKRSVKRKASTRKHSYRFVDRWIAVTSARRKLERYVIRCQVNDVAGAVRDPELEGATILMAEVGENRTTALADGRTARGELLDRYGTHLDGGGAAVMLPAAAREGTTIDVDLQPLLPLLLGDVETPHAIAKMKLVRASAKTAELTGSVGFASSDRRTSYDGDVFMLVDLADRRIASLTLTGHVTAGDGEGTFKCGLTTRTGRPAISALRQKPQHRTVTHRYQDLAVDLCSHWFLAEATANHAIFVSTVEGGDAERRLMIATIETDDPRNEIRSTIQATRGDDQEMSIKPLRTRLGSGKSLRWRAEDQLLVHDLIADRGRMIQVSFVCRWKRRFAALKDLAAARKTLRRAE